MPLEMVEANISYAVDIMAYKQEFLDAGDNMDGTGMLRESGTAEEYIYACGRLSSKASCPEGYVPSTQYFGVVDGRIIGMIDLRHSLDTPELERFGGHIGYSVRPGDRGHGYAGLMLAWVLRRAKERGIDNVLITCLEGNIASEKTIRRCGGTYESTVITDRGKKLMRFWINT